MQGREVEPNESKAGIAAHLENRAFAEIRHSARERACVYHESVVRTRIVSIIGKNLGLFLVLFRQTDGGQNEKRRNKKNKRWQFHGVDR